MHVLTAQKLAYPLLGYVFCFLLNSFFPAEIWLILMNSMVGLVLLTSFHRMKPSYQGISGLLIATGAYLLISKDATGADWLRSTLPNAGITCLLITVPLLGITLYFEPYLDCLRDVLPRYVKTPFHFYTVTTLFANFLASLLNIAAIPFLHQLFAGVAGKYPQRLFYHAISRGVAPNLLWSPSYVSVAIALQYMGLSWGELVPMGLLLAATGLGVALLLGRLELLRNPIPALSNPSNATELVTPANFKYLYKLAAQMVLLIGFILLLEVTTHKSALVTVPLVSLTAPILLAIVWRRMALFKTLFNTYFTVQLPKMYNQMILFSAISFFGYGLGMSDFGPFISQSIGQLGLVSPLAVIPLLILLISLPGFAGVHPVITISAIAVTLAPAVVGLSQLQMTGAFLTGYLLYTILSPFSGTTIVLAAVTKNSNLDMSLKLNLVYGFLLALANTLVLVWIM